MNLVPFPFDILSNFANFLVLVIFLLFFYKKKFIDKKIFLALLISSLSPFFVNDFLFPWEYMYDQIRYSITTYHLRNFDFSLAEFEYGKIGSTVRFSSYLYFLIPIPFIFHISALGFMNKLIYIWLYVYLYKKNYLTNFTSLFYLFFPSLILYTSLSLRDMLVCSVSIISCIFFMRRKYISSFLVGILALLLKPSFFAFMIIILLVYLLFIELYVESKIKAPFIISCGIFIVLFFTYGDVLFDYANFYRAGMYWDIGTSKSMMPIIHNKYDMIFHVLKNSFSGFLKPNLYEIKNTLTLFQSVENIFLIGFLIILFKNLFKKSKLKFFYWLIALLLLIGVYNTMVPNFGTFVRYKFTIIMTFVTLISFEIKRTAFLKNEKK